MKYNGFKICKKCGLLLENSMFGFTDKFKKYLDPNCKKCASVYAADLARIKRVKKNPEKFFSCDSCGFSWSINKGRFCSHCGKKEIEIANGQIFTSKKTAIEMLNLLGSDAFRNKDNIFFEPSCGNGDILVEIIERVFYENIEKTKKFNFSLVESVFCFFAVELDFELCKEARRKVFNIIILKVLKLTQEEKDEFIKTFLAKIISERIKCDNFFDVMDRW